MEWSQLKQREKTALLLLGAAAFFGIYMRMIVQPISRQVTAFKSQKRNSEIQLKDLEAKNPQNTIISANIRKLEEEELELTEAIGILEKKMPSQFDTSQLVGEATRLAREVKLESVKQ